MALKGITVGSTNYAFDYEYLANKPANDLPSIGQGDDGKAVVVNNGTYALGDALPTTSSAAYMLVSQGDGDYSWYSVAELKTLLGISS